MKLNQTKEEYMDDQVAFEMAMHRVQNQERDQGRNPNFRELLDLAKQEVAQEYDRAVALVAHLPEED